MNMVKLQVTEWVERTGDKEGSISDVVNWGTGRTDRNLPPCDGNLPLAAILCQHRDD